MSHFASILVAALVFTDQPSSSSNVKDLNEERLARFLEAVEIATQPAPDPREIKEKAALKEKVERAFGKGCAELRCCIKIWIPARGLLLTAREFHIGVDGRIECSSCSIAQLSRAGDGFDPTKFRVLLRRDKVKIKLDQPAASILDLGSRELREIVASDGRLLKAK
jgi:hypothetical protein